MHFYQPKPLLKYIFFTQIFFLWVSPFETQATVDTNSSLPPSLSPFQQGVEAFEKGRFLEAEKLFLTHIQKNPHSHRAFYNLGVLYRKTKQPIKSIASFRHALLLKNSLFYFKNSAHEISAYQHLKQLQDSPSFWFFIPHELFYILISVSLFLLFLSIQKWKVILLSFISFMSAFFFYSKNQPRFTALQPVLARSAPYEKASTVFTLKAGTWVREISSKSPHWVQIKSKNQGTGWVPRSYLF